MHVDKNDVAVTAIGLPINLALRPLLRRRIEGHCAARIAIVPELLEKEATQPGSRAAWVVGAKVRRCGTDRIEGPPSASLPQLNCWAVRPVVVAADETDPPIPVLRSILTMRVTIDSTSPSDHGTGSCNADH
jgi:hypothetical protein